MDKTIFILLDACQYEAGIRNLGYLEHMAEYGQCARYKVRGELPSLSRPAYASLLTGLPVYRHGITYNGIRHTLSCDSVFSLCKKAGGHTAAAVYSWHSELFNHGPFDPQTDRIQLEGDGAIEKGIFYWDDNYPDSHVFADGEYLRKTYHPDFMMYHTMAVDEQGHLKGSESQAYETAIAQVSEQIAALMPEWLSEGWQVVITADHGMNRFGLHGGTDSDQRDTPLYIFSGKVKKGRFEDQYISQLNIAPLLCRLLDISPGAEMRPAEEILWR